MRLFVVDDHPVVSEGLAARYAADAAYEIAGTSATIADALHVAGARRVDVAVVDVQLESLLTPRQVAALAGHCRVVLYSARAGEPYVRQLLAAGASAVVDKGAPLAELDAVLREVHAGRAPPATRAAAPSRTAELLSEREYEVYRALAACLTPKEVAAQLGLARSTVYCHVENIRRKLGLQTLQEIVARAGSEA